MSQLTANDFSPEILQLFDRYVHGDLSRRGFLDAATRTTGSALAATAALAALMPQFAAAQVVSPTDVRLHIRTIEFANTPGYGSVRAYVAKPAQAGSQKLPVVLVVHENRGLNPHIEDIARRLALEGFMAVAPDSLAPLGGYPGDEDKARELFAKLDQVKMRADFVHVAKALRTRPEGNGKVGVVGFCFGGGMSNYLATQVPDLNAAVPFYGPAPTLADVGNIKAPLLIHFAGLDERINAGWPAYEAALTAAGTKYEAHIYAGTQHGFNNDTTPRFDATAAALAWGRTLAFFKKHL